MNVCASGCLHASAPTSRPSHQVTDNKVTLKSTAVCVKNNCANTKPILGQQDFTADQNVFQKFFLLRRSRGLLRSPTKSVHQPSRTPCVTSGSTRSAWAVARTPSSTRGSPPTAAPRAKRASPSTRLTATTAPSRPPPLAALRRIRTTASTTRTTACSIARVRPARARRQSSLPGAACSRRLAATCTACDSNPGEFRSQMT